MNDSKVQRQAAPMVVTAFGFTIFVGALLLFQVQPLIARYVLPWFGGSPSVWTTCMLFFQAMLLAGYAYSHLVVTRLAPRRQILIHLVLLVLAALSLPIVPSASLAPTGGEEPTGRILLILLVSVGLPFAVLATTSPLLQRWYTLISPGASPYRFYALSNAGSLLGLLSYPFVVEPLLTRLDQARLWGVGFALQVLACGLCAVLLWRRSSPTSTNRGEDRGAEASPPSTVDRLLWLALPAAASVLLLAFTNQICQDVASMPFLWVVPLALYLISFVLCFDRRRWYRRRIFAVLLVLALEGTWAVLLGGRYSALWVQVSTLCAALFVICMVCHGELYHRRPVARHLTAYYLLIALGGALGGVLVAIIAPLVFNGYFELHLGLAATVVLAQLCYRISTGNPHDELPRWARLGLVPVLSIVLIALATHALTVNRDVVAVERNFHGVLRIVERDRSDPVWHRLVMMHGGTDHGFQYQAPERMDSGTAYYGEGSGAGVALTAMVRPNGRRVGLVGLGAGVLAGFARDGDSFRFYELNPAVTRLARRHFSYLERSLARVEVVDGDGRILLERELPGSLDVLVLDAFSSDAIPVHLLTLEAFAWYQELLVDDGVLAAHLTNRHMDLVPVVASLAATWSPVPRVHVLNSARDDRSGAYSATYVVLSKNTAVDSALEAAGAIPPTAAQRGRRPWTDDHSSPLEVISWR